MYQLCPVPFSLTLRSAETYTSNYPADASMEEGALRANRNGVLLQLSMCAGRLLHLLLIGAGCKGQR